MHFPSPLPHAPPTPAHTPPSCSPNLAPQTISYLSTLNTLSTENASSCPLARPSTLATSTLANEPAATKPTLTGKNASASPSHLNSSEPVGASDEMLSIVHVKEEDWAVQLGSEPEVREGSELGLGVSTWGLGCHLDHTG